MESEESRKERVWKVKSWEKHECSKLECARLWEGQTDPGQYIDRYKGFSPLPEKLISLSFQTERYLIVLMISSDYKPTGILFVILESLNNFLFVKKLYMVA